LINILLTTFNLFFAYFSFEQAFPIKRAKYPSCHIRFDYSIDFG